MFFHYRTQGFILKKENRGEADQILTVYTKDFGKLEILAKSIRKITSKLRSGAEVFYLSEIEFVQGKNYKTLTDAIALKKFEKIRKNVLKLDIAFRISEVVDQLVRGEEVDERIWYLLKETFTQLNNQKLKSFNLQLLYYYFFWNLLSYLGYRPELYNCVLCQKRLKPERLYFSSKEGGVICQNCFEKNKTTAIFIKPEIIKILREMLKKNWKILERLKKERTVFYSLEKISKNSLGKILENNEKNL